MDNHIPVVDPIEKELEEVKSTRISMSKSHVFSFITKSEGKYSQGTHEWFFEAFKEANTIWKNILKMESKNYHDKAFFLMHLYIRLVLQEKLHKRRNHATFGKDSATVLSNLRVIEGKMEHCLAGVRKQIVYKQQLEAEKAAAAKQMELKRQEEEQKREREIQEKIEKEEAERRKEQKEREEREKAEKENKVDPFSHNKIDNPSGGPIISPGVPLVPVAGGGGTQNNVNNVPPPAYPDMSKDSPSIYPNNIPNNIGGTPQGVPIAHVSSVPNPSNQGGIGGPGYPGHNNFNIKPNPSLPNHNNHGGVVGVPAKPGVMPVVTSVVKPTVTPVVKPSVKPDVKKIDPWEKIHISKLRVKQIRGDGHCAFRAVAQGLAYAKQTQFLVDRKESMTAGELRVKACDLLRRNKKNVIGTLGLTVEQVITMDPDSKHDTFESYVSGMRKSDYAGEVEISLLAYSIPANISIYKLENGFYRRMAKYGTGKGPLVNMLWNQGMSEAGNHYNLLVPNT